MLGDVFLILEEKIRSKRTHAQEAVQPLRIQELFIYEIDWLAKKWKMYINPIPCREEGVRSAPLFLGMTTCTKTTILIILKLFDDFWIIISLVLYFQNFFYEPLVGPLLGSVPYSLRGSHFRPPIYKNPRFSQKQNMCEVYIT